MSREIKFRAWEKYAKKYYYGAEHTYDFMCSGEGCYAESFGEVLDNERFIVEQYTGLKDKNGKEIYEGDIVRLYDRYVSAITWQDNYCGFRWYGDGDGYRGLGKDNEEYYEVIGNIHENLELLEV